MAYPVSIYGAYGYEKETSTTQKHRLGTRMELPDGRVFYYAEMGGSAVTAGKALQQAVVVSGHTKDLVVTAGAIGDQSITVTLATTAAVKNLYQDGVVFINDAVGEGQLWRIKEHEAGTSTGSVEFKFYDNDSIATAVTSASEAGLRLNLYKDVIIAPTTLTGVVVGATPVDVAADAFFWCQTWGELAGLTAGTVVVGEPVVTGVTTAGAFSPWVIADTSAVKLPLVGRVQSVAASTEYSLIDLQVRR